ATPDGEVPATTRSSRRRREPTTSITRTTRTPPASRRCESRRCAGRPTAGRSPPDPEGDQHEQHGAVRRAAAGIATASAAGDDLLAARRVTAVAVGGVAVVAQLALIEHAVAAARVLHEADHAHVIERPAAELLAEIGGEVPGHAQGAMAHMRGDVEIVIAPL